MISLFRELVCEVYGITTDEFNSRTKARNVVEARVLFYKLCCKAKIVDKEAVMFMGRTIQSSYIYKDLLDGKLSESEDFNQKYRRCLPMFYQIVNKCKNSSATHSITKYTKAEELMILRAMMNATRYMRTYGMVRR